MRPPSSEHARAAFNNNRTPIEQGTPFNGGPVAPCNRTLVHVVHTGDLERRRRSWLVVTVVGLHRNSMGIRSGLDLDVDPLFYPPNLRYPTPKTSQTSIFSCSCNILAYQSSNGNFKIGGPQYRPQNVIVLIIGTHKGIQIFGKPHIQ